MAEHALNKAAEPTTELTAEQLITDNLNIWATTVEQKSPSGRGSSKKFSLHGIKKLRELILELAVRGKLTPQDENEEPASALLGRIAAEKAQLVKDKKIKKPKALPEISEDEKPFELPSGWEFKRINDIGIIFNGNSVNARLKEQKYTGLSEGLPFIATKDVGYGFEDLDYDNGVLIPLEEPKFKVARKNSVLICAEGGSAGKKCGIATQNICFGNKLFAIEVHDNFEPKFVLSFYLTPTFYSMFSASMTGIIGGISSAKFSELLIPVPPPAEQHRIIAKVDELMSLCDTLEAQTEASLIAHQTLVETLLGALLFPSADATRPESSFTESWQRIAENFDTLFTTSASIDALKQAILQLAVMGKLVEQKPNDEPATKLLDYIATEKKQLIKDKRIKKQRRPLAITEEEKLFELPASWEWCRVINCMENLRDISYGIIKLGTEPDTGGIPTLRCSDVKPRYIDMTNVRNVSEEIEIAYARTRLNGGEVLVNIRGTLGGVSLVPNELAGFNIAREVAMLPLHPTISGEYIVNVINSPFFWKKIESNLKGIAYKGLNLNILRDFVIPLPPIKEQHRIVAKVAELIALCDQIKSCFASTEITQRHLTDTLVEQAIS
ncbi:type I restriction endonuclease EcoAI subunit S [Shewanella colwelliana]|uniref:Type I restriction endonuclease EcoAI subunit S n=1 Tax=Shewanella colwelliana TaxID=23 RepID=A0ABQ4PA58_SHECO|nr:restriction endonuclease subunit S [Shewanella colwelliana]GIU44410.1 type I restriction endonuclease EcoAI subunit S [Shewanella colwelliana]